MIDLWAQVGGEADSYHRFHTKKPTPESVRKANASGQDKSHGRGEGHYRKANALGPDKSHGRRALQECNPVLLVGSLILHLRNVG